VHCSAAIRSLRSVMGPAQSIVPVRLHLGCMASRSSVTSRSCRLATAACVGPGDRDMTPGRVPAIRCRDRDGPGFGRVGVPCPVACGGAPSRAMRGWIRSAAGLPRSAVARSSEGARFDASRCRRGILSGRAGPVWTWQQGLHLTGAANERAHSGDQLRPDVVARVNTTQYTDVLVSAGPMYMRI